MDEQQASRLDQILPWAQVAGKLLVSEQPYLQQLHLRPAAKSIRVVDLNPARPQLDRGEITSIQHAGEQLRH